MGGGVRCAEVGLAWVGLGGRFAWVSKARL